MQQNRKQKTIKQLYKETITNKIKRLQRLNKLKYKHDFMYNATHNNNLLFDILDILDNKPVSNRVYKKLKCFKEFRGLYE